MNNTYKEYLTLTIIGALVVFALSAIWFVASYSKAAEPVSFRSFSVSGEGEASVVPDIAIFSFGVVTQGGIDLTAIQKQNSEKANSAIAFVKGKGVQKEDIATQYYNVDPRYQYYNCFEGRDACPPPDIVGYTVTQSVRVKVRDFSVIGELLSGVVENGANTVTQLSFTLDDPTQVQNEARAKAIEKAKLKAEAIAKAGGFKIGRLLSIQEGQSFFPYQAVSEGGKGGAGPVPPSIEPGSQKVNVSVTLVYEIR